MRITEIRKTKKGRMSIYLDGEFACVLSPELFWGEGLAVGAEIAPEYLDELRARSGEKMAKERALGLLARRAYTEQGLYDKILEKVEDQAAAAGAVARMAELGLVDDADYARRYARECIFHKGYSKRRAAYALEEKGISKELAEDALEELELDPEQAVAELVLKKYRRYLAEEKGVRKTIAALQRLGHSYGTIRTVLAHLAEDEGYYEADE